MKILKLIVFTACFSFSFTLNADGKSFARDYQLQTADQQAILIDRGDEQEIIILNELMREGANAKSEDDIAWVVPLPAKPTITPYDANVFRYLEDVSQPRTERGDLAGRGLFFFVVFLILGLVALASRRSVSILFCGFLILFVMAILLPSFGTSRGGGGFSSVVVNKEIVGAYETAILHGLDGDQSSDANAVIGWLKANGFKVSQTDEAVFSDYIAKKWYFAAIRLKTSQGATINPHPLRFRFQHDKTLYPMKLTGSGQQQPMSVDLFVFSDKGQAASQNFVTLFRQIYPGVDPEHRFAPNLSPRWRAISNPPPTLHTLHGQQLNGMVLTRLRRQFSPLEMNRDVSISFQKRVGVHDRHDRYVKTYYSANHVIGLILNCLALGLYAFFSCMGRQITRRGEAKDALLIDHFSVNVLLAGLWCLLFNDQADLLFLASIIYAFLLIVVPAAYEMVSLNSKRVDAPAKLAGRAMVMIGVTAILGTTGFFLYGYSRLPDRHSTGRTVNWRPGAYQKRYLLDHTIPWAIHEEVAVLKRKYDSADALAAAIVDPENKENKYLIKADDLDAMPERGKKPLQWQIILLEGRWRYVVFDNYGSPYLWAWDEKEAWTYFPEILDSEWQKLESGK